MWEIADLSVDVRKVVAFELTGSMLVILVDSGTQLFERKVTVRNMTMEEIRVSHSQAEIDVEKNRLRMLEEERKLFTDDFTA